jgi:coenzyme PQQ synthesis protein D (PqqD)
MISGVPTLSLESIVVRRAEPMTAPVDGELVMLDPRTSTYYGLDAIGHRIWDLLEEPQPVSALCEALQAEFDVPADTCRSDVLAFLERLEGAGLLEAR